MTWPAERIHCGRDGMPMISDVFRERQAAWRQFAACRGVDPDLFFPPESKGAAGQRVVREARKVCSTCPVQTECAVYALRTGQKHGVWAGMSTKELRRARAHLAPYLRDEDVA